MKKIGKQSIVINSNVSIHSGGSIVGKIENEGPIGQYFDVYDNDYYFGEDSWERAETKLLRSAIEIALKNGNMIVDDIDYILSGDLLNQSMSSTFAIKGFEKPYFGLFAACSSIGESLSLSSMLLDGDFASNIVVGASSHFCTAQKQFRNPLGLGDQRNMTTTWTVTGGGSMVIKKDGDGPCIKKITTGKIVDKGIKDANNMGAAMAPSAYDTIKIHHEEFNLSYDYYDIILTGDLGIFGGDMLLKLFEQDNVILNNYNDCGRIIFDANSQDTHQGGSGCACSATTFASYILPKLKEGKLNKILFVPTGALLSTTSLQQGLSIPCISHAVSIEN